MNWHIPVPFAHYLASSSPIVQLVLLILIIASIVSWTIIFQRWFALGTARRAVRRFEKKFFKADNHNDLIADIEARPKKIQGLSAIFKAGFHEAKRIRRQRGLSHQEKVESIQRVMRVSANYEEEDLEANLPLLGTIGSVSPYVGLFGTVWGIMMSFHALGGAQQVTIAMVAPGISEALVATALGLFAAIPAVIFYNRYINQVDRIMNRYAVFQEECAALLGQQLTEEQHDAQA